VSAPKWASAAIAIGAPFLAFAMSLSAFAVGSAETPHRPPTALEASPGIPSSAPPETPPSTEPLPTTSESTATPTSAPDEGNSVDRALVMLEAVGTTLQETGDYNRDLFGQRWADTDRNGCDTRNDILDRDLVDKSYKPGTRDCVVLTGILHDAYSGQDIAFRRGDGTSELVQIDHIVPLAFAWRNGAAAWDDATRLAFANDPVNLLAVDGLANQEKSDLGPADWLPVNTAYRCDYALRWVDVLEHYPLTLPSADRSQLVAILRTC